MTVKIIRRIDAGKHGGRTFDCYVNGQLAISCSSEDNIFAWLARHTAKHGPMTMEWEAGTL